MNLGSRGRLGNGDKVGTPSRPFHGDTDSALIDLTFPSIVRNVGTAG